MTDHLIISKKMTCDLSKICQVTWIFDVILFEHVSVSGYRFGIYSRNCDLLTGVILKFCDKQHGLAGLNLLTLYHA